jgi:hypothetical protein
MGQTNKNEIESMDPNGKALEELKPRLVVMEPEEILRDAKLDATVAGTIAAATAKKVLPFRGALVAIFGAAAGTRVDELPKLARATQQADIAAAAAAAPSDLSAMHEEVRDAYDLLSADAQGMVHRKLIPAHELDKTKDIQGYEATVRSTLILVAVLRRYWEQVKDQTPLTEADLDRTQRTAERMLDTKGDRDQGVPQVPANELRLRALSLLIRTYREIFREVQYLRFWEGDADTIVPSLWSGRGRRPRIEENDDGDLDTDTDVTGPIAGPGVPVDPGVNPLTGG